MIHSDDYLPEVPRIRQVTAPFPAFLALTEMQYSSPIDRVCWMPSVILQLSACPSKRKCKFSFPIFALNFNSGRRRQIPTCTHLSSRMGLDVERSVRDFLAAVLDVYLVLAKIIGRVGSFESSVAVVGYLDFARISIRALLFVLESKIYNTHLD